MTPSDLQPEVCALLQRYGLLQELVVRWTRSAEVEHIQPSDGTVQQARQALSQQLGLESADRLEDHYRQLGQDPDLILWQVLLPQRVRDHCRATYGPKAEARFLDRKAELDAVVYSLLRVREPGLANELFLRISGAEASFGDLAATYSEGHEKATRGLIGPAPMAKAHPVLRDLLRTATPGAVNPPISLEGWQLIVRLESRIPAVLDDTTRVLMEQELFEADIQLKASALMAGLQQPSSTPQTPCDA